MLWIDWRGKTDKWGGYYNNREITVAWNLVVLKNDEKWPDSGFILRESLGDVLIDWMQSIRVQQGAKGSEQLIGWNYYFLKGSVQQALRKRAWARHSDREKIYYRKRERKWLALERNKCSLFTANPSYILSMGNCALEGGGLSLSLAHSWGLVVT